MTPLCTYCKQEGNALIKDLNFKCFNQMTSKTDSVDHVTKSVLFGNLL